MARGENPVGAIFALPILYMVLTGKFGAMFNNVVASFNSTQDKPVQTQLYFQQSDRTLDYQRTSDYQKILNHQQNYHYQNSLTNYKPVSHFTSQGFNTVYYTQEERPLPKVICNYYTDFCKHYLKETAMQSVVNNFSVQ